jgi:hypothetical protein
MQWKQLYQRIEYPLELLTKWVSYIGTIAILVGVVSQFFAWGSGGPFAYIRDNLQTIWLSVATIAIITLWIWTSRLNRRFVSRFSDNFSEDLKRNWDFEGPWRIVDQNTLLVTGSDAGGLTKVGASWENYTLSFEARITNHCLGVIVRAQDLNNYYMFQINKDKIRPHRRIAVPVIEEETSKTQSKLIFRSHEMSIKDKTTTEIIAGDVKSDPKTKKEAASESLKEQGNQSLQELPNLVNFAVAWQIIDPPVPVNPNLDGWFKVRIVVRGEAVSIYLNDELQLQQESFLKLPTGKIGFRNSGKESALVKNVQVRVQP